MHSHNSVVVRFHLRRYKAGYLQNAGKAPFYFLYNLSVVKLALTTTTQPKYTLSAKPRYNFFFSKKTKKITFLIKKPKAPYLSKFS